MQYLPPLWRFSPRIWTVSVLFQDEGNPPHVSPVPHGHTPWSLHHYIVLANRRMLQRQCFYNYVKSSLQHSLLPIAGGRTELATCDQSEYCRKFKNVYNNINADGPHVRVEIGHTRYLVIHCSRSAEVLLQGLVDLVTVATEDMHVCVPYPLRFSLICVYLKWNFSQNFVFHFW